MKDGIVKWFRDDGVGLIVENGKPNEVILVHYSAISQTRSFKILTIGQRVRFKTKKILGRDIATYVKPI